MDSEVSNEILVRFEVLLLGRVYGVEDGQRTNLNCGKRRSGVRVWKLANDLVSIVGQLM